MAQVYLFKENGYHLWDQEVFEALGYTTSPLTEVPDDIIDRYNKAYKEFSEVQDILEKYYKNEIQ